MNIFKTKNNNNYILEETHQQLYICHPLVMELKNNSNALDISKKETSDDELNYYRRKIKFLESHNILNSKPLDYLQKFHTSPESLKREFANCNHFVFEVTELCNLACKYCTWGEIYDINNRANSNFNLKRAFLMINEIFNLHNSSLNSSFPKEITIGFYGGEPLLNFDFIKAFVEYINSHKGDIEVNFSITTNGLLLDKYMDYIAENVFRLTISLDGDKENNFYRTFSNNKSSFKRVFENASLLKVRYPDYYSKYVSFMSVLHNKNSVQSTTNFIEKHFNKIPMIGELNPIGLKSQKNPEYVKVYKSYFESFDKNECIFWGKKNVESKLDGTRHLLRSYNRFLIQNYNELNFVKRNYRYNTGTCNPLGRKVFFSANNGDFLCERIGQKYDLKIFDNDGELSFEKASFVLNDIFDKAYRICKKCSKNFLCKHCIFTMDIGTKAKCKYFLNEDKYSYYIKELLAYFEENPNLHKETFANCSKF